MHRRSFLHCASLATAALVFGPRRAHAGGLLPPLFISIEANQAWDTTTSIDPHGHPAFSTYAEADIVVETGDTAHHLTVATVIAALAAHLGEPAA